MFSLTTIFLLAILITISLLIIGLVQKNSQLLLFAGILFALEVLFTGAFLFFIQSM